MSPTLHDDRALALDALHAIDAGCTRDEWFRAGVAALASGLDLEDVDAWSATAENYKGTKDVRAAFGRLKPDGRIRAGTLFFMARAQGWTPPKDDIKRKPRLRLAKAAIRPVEEPQHAPMSDYAQQLWRNTYDLRNTVGADYLKARRCVLPPEDGDLRFHPALRHRTGYVGPALVALVTNVLTRAPMSLHQTWVLPDGTKPAHLGDEARRNFKGHNKKGGCIRLWPDECVTTGLAVAEGIETALSVVRDYAPAWSLIDAGNLASFPVLDGIEFLLIGADNDSKEAGIKAAKTCGERWAAAGVEALVAMPKTVGTDWNDMEAA